MDALIKLIKPFIDDYPIAQSYGEKITDCRRTRGG